MTSDARPGRRKWIEVALVAAAFSAVAWFFGWTVKSAGGLAPPGPGDYYHLLVEGFHRGHLYLPNAPNPRLLHLADPYDPAQNHAFRLPDASYFRGHYYLYFGATPAVTLMWPYQAITGRPLSSGAAVLIFILVGYAALTGLWLALRRRHFPGSSAGVAALGVLMLGLATHTLALARRPDFWELSIAAGFAWTMLALAAVYRGLHARRPIPAFVLAGICLGLAVGARPPCLFAAVMFLPALWHRWQDPATRPTVWRCALAAAVPLGLCGAAILAYNFARFGNPLEFGQSYQLTGIHEARAHHFSLRYFLPNLAIYGFTWPRWSWVFPFVSAARPGSGVPGYLGGEEICGLAVTLPFLWLAGAAPLAWTRRAPGTATGLRTMILAIAGAGVAVAGLILSYFSATERYMAEFTPAFALLACIGMLEVEARVRRPGRRRAVFLMFGGLGVATAVMAALISFDYHSRLLHRTDPTAWSRLSSTSRRITDLLPLWVGARRGPMVFKLSLPAHPPGTVGTLLEAGLPPVVDRVLLAYTDARHVRLGWERSGLHPLWSEPVAYEPGRPQVLTVQMGSLYPPSPPDAAAGDDDIVNPFREHTGVALWLDRRLVLGALTAPAAGGLRTLVMNRADFVARLRWRGVEDFSAERLSARIGANWALAGPPPAAGRIPLLAWERQPPGDLLALETAGPGSARLVYEHPGIPELTSPRFPVGSAKITLEVEHGPNWPSTRPDARSRPLVVWADNRLVWQVEAPATRGPSDEPVFARNAVDAPGCAATAPGWHRVPSPPPRRPGGTLRLRLVLPTGVVGTSEPLLELGRHRGSTDLLGIRYEEGDAVRIRLDHWGSPLLAGPRVPLQSLPVHIVEITLPSCTADAFGTPRTGAVLVRIDGIDALRATSACFGFAPDAWAIGRNDVGGTTCGPAFSGWILDARWMRVPE